MVKPMETFKLGLISSLTGGSAYYGRVIANGVELAVNTINQSGSLHLYIVSVDDRGVSALASSAVDDLCAQDVRVHDPPVPGA